MSEAIYGLLRSSSSRHQPWQLAAALAMGVLCGLLPKLSFLFCLIGCGCVLLPIHLPLAALTCAVASLAAMAAVPLAGRLGLWSLTHPVLISFWSTLDALPLIPWLGLHNSVVNGSILMGLGLWLPVYLATRPIARRLAASATVADTVWLDPDFTHELKPAVASVQRPTTPVSKLPIAIAWADSLPPPERLETPARLEAPVDHQLQAVPQVVEDPNNDGTDPCTQLQHLLERCRSEEGSQLSVEEVVERATQMAVFVDELLTVCAAEESPAQAAGRTRPPDNATGDPSRVENYIVENFSELAYSSQAGEEFSYMRPTPALPLFSNQPFTAQQHRVANGPLVSGTGELLKRHQQHREPLAVNPPVRETADRVAVGVERQQEALRYLLHHLKAFKDKV